MTAAAPGCSSACACDGSDTIDGQAGYDRLDFNGSNAGEQITVTCNNSRTRLFRDIAAVTQDFDTIEDVHVRALGSADTVTIGDLSGTGNSGKGEAPPRSRGGASSRGGMAVPSRAR